MSDQERPPEAEDQFEAEPEEHEDDQVSRMPFLAHLEELRSRLVRSAIAVGVAFLGTYLFKEQLYQGLARPLKAAMPPDAKLIYTAPAEAFFTYLKIALLAAIVVASPFIFYQFWRFIAPGLYDHERKAVWPFVLVSSVLFIVGAVFCYTMVFPYAFQFFMSFATDDIVPMLSLKSYLSFSATLLFAFGVIFEMPLVLVFLGRIGVVTSKGLKKNRKYAILIMFVAGAMFTPPDVVTQCMMAVPLILLYEISTLMVAATEKKKAARQEAEEAEFADEDDEPEQ
ncbi:MAG: twin-arginine translocase subunit TatC [Desulfarculaceae bacterium]|nr:twin-arginine translocase subunit TatC [Desulfarculaceae bacterium]MCF8071649.1 twin-arginine translocase subunit TatC [Desulfarculaceae bacterium]MCF8102504.1 twin-arginine translocase subunit TatC [Desulfarculaceae bacterium]MCF8114928.1 twin-arginine translocase subunit TatC [Desulfarculaceae bacterium]